MHITNIIESRKTGAVAQVINLEDQSKQVVVITLDAGKELKAHISKTDAILIVEKGSAYFTLWEKELPVEYLIKEHDIVSFKANKLHAISALENFSAILIK